jgi:hypothetical protein
MRAHLLGIVASVIGAVACSANDSSSSYFSSGGASAVPGQNGGQTATVLPSGSGAAATSAGGASFAGSPAAPSGGGAGFFSVGPAQSNDCSNRDISILILVDRSGSMNCNLPPTTTSTDCEAMSPPAKVDANQPSKWEVIAQTLTQSLGELAMLDGSVHVRAGLSFFSVDGVCSATSAPTVPVDVATPSQLDAIGQALTKQTPKGGTPIVGATVLAYKHLYQTLAVTSNAHVILITDGKDSCSAYYAAQPSIGPDDQVAKLISTQAPAALGVGIKTWVIGAPGSEVARSMLSSLAVAGGTRRSDGCTPGTAADPTVGDCHYDMTTGDLQSTLSAALQQILRIVTCQTIR